MYFSNDAVIVFKDTYDNNIGKLLKSDNSNIPNTYDVHILSSLGSEYIIRGKNFDNSTNIIRIPKEHVQTVIYDYKEKKPEAGKTEKISIQADN